MRPVVLLLLGAAACAQDFSNIRVEKVATGYKFTEGPVWSREGFLLFSDVPSNHILKFTPGHAPVVWRQESNGGNGNTFDAQGRLYTCESRTRRLVRTDKKGNIEVIAEKWQGKRLNAPNDVVVSRNGHVYFTDPAFGNQAEGRELDFYGTYHVTPKGEMHLIARTPGRPNGIALAPDGRTLYVADSDDRLIRAYDVDRNGAASKERVFVSNIDGSPDGIRVDEKGNLYVTCKTVAVFSPQAKLITSIEFSEMPRNCTFGDPDFQTLYVTAMTSLYRVRLNVKGFITY